jgi:hypothetical protein
VGGALEERDQRRGRDAQDDGPVGKHEAISPACELAGQIAVAGHEEGQPRKVREGGVRGEGQDDHRDALDEIVEKPAAEDLPGQLRDDRLLVPRHDLVARGQHRDADEQRDHDQPEGDQHPLGVAHLGRLERGDAVGHRLDAGEGDRPRRERAQEQEDPDVAEGRRGRMRDRGRRRPHSANPAEP